MLTALTEIKNTIVSIEQEYNANRYKNNSVLKMRRILDLTKEKYKNGLRFF